MHKIIVKEINVIEEKPKAYSGTTENVPLRQGSTEPSLQLIKEKA